MSSQSQENYLQRQGDIHKSFMFDWFACCTSGHTSKNQDLKVNASSIIIKKKPLRSLANTNRSFRKNIKLCDTQNSKFANSERSIVYMKPSSTTTETPYPCSSDIQNKLQEVRRDISIKDCKNRFSYIYQKDKKQNIDQEYKHSSFKAPTVLQDLAKNDQNNSFFSNISVKNEAVFNQNANLLTRNESGEKSPRKKPINSYRDSSRQNLVSLKMRQVQSIKQPQDDSDHESIVLDRSDHALYSLLAPIRQMQKQSNISKI